MQTYGASYSRDGDCVLFYDQAWWVGPLEWLFVPLIRFGMTYPLGNRLLNLVDRGRVEVHREPLPDALAGDAWWRT